MNATATFVDEPPSAAFTPSELDAEQDAKFGDIIPSRLRADVIVQRQFFNGREYYVLKDPLALTYFRLKPEEVYLTTLLNGKRPLREVFARYNARHPNAAATVEDVALFINQLGTAGLLNIGARRFMEHVQPNGVRRVARPKSLLGLWAKLIGGILFVKIPLVDPSPWLGKLAHALRFVWTKWFVGAALVLFAWTIGFLIYHRAAFSEPIDNFFAPSNLILLWVSVIIIKTFHEFGHATTCRHFGGEVHEMGLCFMCFTPCGYVDASDAWMMRFKRHKVFTTIGGVFTEFILACIAAHLWLFLPDGLARSLAFNAMIVASVNTVFFNANPLMRFDGYYILCDLLEVPNLRTKAITFCSARVRGWLLGYRDHDLEYFTERDKGPAFVVYALCAYFYMFVIIYGLTLIFARVLEPYGLKQFGLAIGVFVEGSYAMLPVIKAVSDGLAENHRLTRTDAPLRRVGKWLGGLSAAGLVIFFWPTHFAVHQQGVVFCEEGESIAASVPGRVAEVFVHTGQWVEAGQPLLRLESVDRVEDWKKDQADYEIAKLRLANAASQKRWDYQDQLPQAGLLLDSAGVDVERSTKNLERLVLHSTVAGRVLTADVDKLVGTFLKPGALAVRIGDPRQFKLIVPLTEEQARLVEPGAKLEGRFLANGAAFHTTVEKVPRQRARENELHAAMFTAFGGPLPQPNGARPHTGMMADAQLTASSVYLAEAIIDHPPEAVREAMRARVHIQGHETVLGKRIWRAFLTLWRLKVPV